MTENGPKPSKTDLENQGKIRSGPLETLFTVLSLILLLAIAGYLLKESLSHRTPPQLEVSHGFLQSRGTYQYLVVEVENSGDQTAKAVNISGTATDSKGETVQAEATMDWLPGRSKRMATLVFPGDAQPGTPEIQIIGFEEP